MCRDCCNKILRATICSVNLLVLITGILITLAGLWLLVMEYLSPSPSLSTLSLTILVAGLLTLTLSFLACCGSLVPNSALLVTFSVLLSSLIAGQAALGVAVYIKEVDLSVFVSRLSREVVEERYFSNNTFTVLSWDIIQSELGCCGSEGPLDWAASTFNGYSKFTKEIGIRADTSSLPFLLPSSCCKVRELDQSQCDSSILPQRHTLINPAVYYTEGCSRAFMRLAEDNTLLVIALLFCLVLLEVLAVIFSCSLCCRIKKTRSRI